MHHVILIIIIFRLQRILLLRDLNSQVTMDSHREELEDDESGPSTESTEYQRRTSQSTLRLRSGVEEMTAQFENQDPLGSSSFTSNSPTGPDQNTDYSADRGSAHGKMSTSHSIDIHDTEEKHNQDQSYRGGGRGQNSPYSSRGRSRCTTRGRRGRGRGGDRGRGRLRNNCEPPSQNPQRNPNSEMYYYHSHPDNTNLRHRDFKGHIRGGHQGPYLHHDGRSGFQHEYYNEPPRHDFDDRQWGSTDREELFDAEEYNDDEWMSSAPGNPNTYTPHRQRQPHGERKVHQDRNATYRGEKGDFGYGERRGGRDIPRAGYPNRARINEHNTRNSPSPSRSQNRERDVVDGPPREPSSTKLDPSPVTLEVSGFSSSVDEELLQMYFESPKRSGGGDMEGFQMSSSRRSATMVFNEATGKFNIGYKILKLRNILGVRHSGI